MEKSEQKLFCFLESAKAAATSRDFLYARTDYKFCTLEYVTSGRGFLEENGNSWMLEKDDVYILRKHSTHRYYSDKQDPWHKIFFMVDGTLMENIVSDILPPNECVFRQCSQLRSYFETFLSFSLSVRSRDLDRKSCLLFHNLIYDLSKNRIADRMEKNSTVPELKKALDESLGVPFLLKNYAARTGFSRSYLIRCFRKTYGFTPYEYLLHLRIRKAENFLQYTTLRIKEIAELLAFPDQGAFSRCFKTHTGKSPQQFRNDLS